jgi:hypothetical protein
MMEANFSCTESASATRRLICSFCGQATFNAISSIVNVTSVVIRSAIKKTVGSGLGKKKAKMLYRAPVGRS